MLLKIDNLNKSIGVKDLFENLKLLINEGEKVALIGRNGLGKTTLFKILNGEDLDFKGLIELQKGIKIVLTRQEHFLHEQITALEYVLREIPDYLEMKEKLRYLESNLSNNIEMIQEYTDLLSKFNESGYYEIENKVVQSFNDFQLGVEQILAPLKSLSGGEKRFVELVRIMYSGAELALIDEPTNHMDYVGKEAFIKWLNATKQTVLVITHDRDVLKSVDRILELKDKILASFTGNYDAYLKQNIHTTVSDITQYELTQKKIAEARRQMLTARAMKMTAKGDRGRTAARIREERFLKEYNKLIAESKKPSFWIDQESLQEVPDQIVESYEKYKEHNINIRSNLVNMNQKLLLTVKNLSLGYDKPLFLSKDFELFSSDRLFIKGRNGAGKSTLIRTIIAKVNDQKPSAKVFNGSIYCNSKARIGVYEQEIDSSVLSKTLNEAVTDLYKSLDIPINERKLQAILKTYLMDMSIEGLLTLDKLSGGQKARFQLIKMFVNNPNLLILDEPTNHLDLPSIEELESALQTYQGAIIYISHDSYFVNKLGGKVLEIN